jgi:lipopolysaccharide transport system ATP-binding protein
MREAAIHVHGLEKRYRVWTHAPPTNLKERLRVAGQAMRARVRLGETASYRQDVLALRGVSFDVPRGMALGVIGRNGAGKSTLLSILARITEPTGGYAELRGRVSSLLEVGTGFHPELTGRDNVFLNGAILGMSRAETARKYDEIVDFSGVRDFIDIPVKRYSSGMQVRLAFAVAAHLEPEILLLDEVLAVGDQEFQRRCHARVQEMTSSGRTVLFVSHDVNSVARLCQEAIVLNGGLVTFQGSADDAVDYYLLENRPERDGADDTVSSRQGTGTARVRRVAIVDADHGGPPRSGVPVRVEVDLEVSPPGHPKDLRLELVIRTAAGADVIGLATEVAADAAAASGLLSLVCELDGLPLRPTTYLLTSALTQNGELIDRWNNAGELTLAPSEVFQSAHGSSGHAAPVLVRQHWTATRELTAATIERAEDWPSATA